MFNRAVALEARDAARRAARPAWFTWQDLGRAFWIAMLLVHAPAAVRAWRRVLGAGDTPDLQVVSAVWLTAAIVFFVLQIMNVRWLRLRRDRRALCSIAFAVLLLHAAPLGFPLGGVLTPDDVPIVGALLLVGGLENRPYQRFTSGFIRSPFAAKASGSGWHADQARWPVTQAVPITSRAPRSPPALR